MSSRDQSVGLYLSPLRALCSSLSRSSASVRDCRHPVLCVLLHEQTFGISSNKHVNQSRRQFRLGRRRKKEEDKKHKTKARDRVRNPELIVSFLFFICLMCCG